MTLELASPYWFPVPSQQRTIFLAINAFRRAFRIVPFKNSDPEMAGLSYSESLGIRLRHTHLFDEGMSEPPPGFSSQVVSTCISRSIIFMVNRSLNPARKAMA